MKKIKILSIFFILFVVFSNFAITFYISNSTRNPLQFYAYTPKRYIGSGRYQLIAPGKSSRLYDAGLINDIIIHWQTEGKEYQAEIKISNADRIKVGKEFAILENGCFEHNLIGGFKRHHGCVPGHIIIEER